ncbi:MAG: 50S ribosomal protein L30 [Desulfovibrionaceae bacterium]|nr:50S ribosomal protein L30 [Desulfovibrionaceae bacterium]
MIKIRLTRSWIGCSPKQRRVLAALGLKRPGKVKEVPDNAAMRGMLACIPHMVEVL